MDKERTLRFFELYEQLAFSVANVNQEPNIPYIESLLNRIAAMLRLSKGVTHFYRTPDDERRGIGETMISYDTGKPGVPVHTVRFSTAFMSISTMTVYMSEDEPPLSEDEFAKVDLTMRTALAYISRNRLQSLAMELAFFDDSGYRNARSFFNYLTWKGGQGAFDGMAALHYNLRHFSLVNDEFGRRAGDSVMKNHYEHLVGMAGTEGIAARLGGDNFVGIFRQDILPDVLDYLSEAHVPYDEEGNTIMVSACAGVFVIPDGFTVRDPNDIMSKIIPASRIAQTGSKENIVYFDETLLAMKERSMRIQQLFPEALRSREFRVFYQPKVNTFTGEISGAEALCRWFRGDKMISPAEFIPVLEQTSDICKLDFYMLDLVCADIRRWLDEGRDVVRVSVNISRKHMMNFKLLTDIIGIIDSHNVPHEYIEIELTETTTDVEFHDLKRVVGGLQEAKIFTSVDDFGMGYSSLNLIRVIPWNVLKVDRSFLPLDGEDENSVRGVMFRHVVSMAKQLGLECIVEGVETPAQLNILRMNDCELAQGFLFDRPLPVEDFEKRLDMKKYSVDI